MPATWNSAHRRNHCNHRVHTGPLLDTDDVVHTTVRPFCEESFSATFAFFDSFTMELLFAIYSSAHRWSRNSNAPTPLGIGPRQLDHTMRTAASRSLTRL
jgi:hypothetical protein